MKKYFHLMVMDIGEIDNFLSSFDDKFFIDLEMEIILLHQFHHYLL